VTTGAERETAFFAYDAAFGDRAWALAAAGRFDEASELLLMAYRARPASAPRAPLTRTGLEHDLEQRRHLSARGRAPAPDAAAVAAAEAVLADLVRAGAAEADDAQARRLAAFYARPFPFDPPPALPGGALAPGLDRAAVEADYRRDDPGATHFDGLLRPEALAALRRFCLESGVWAHAHYRDGYVGATVGSGFCAPLLLQVAAELAAAFPGLFAGHGLRNMWAFHYGASAKGIRIHADDAAVNVNFWVTPDEANLDPASGGLVLWRKAAPADWSFKEYNADEDRARRFVEGTPSVRVPHRQNRAVVFHSSLFHRTDDLRFRPGYEDHRLNITLLFGRGSPPRSA
jgi:hypothetical protein